MPTDPPRRRVRLVIEVQADTWDDAQRKAADYLGCLELSRQLHGIDRDAPGSTRGFSGPCSYGLDVDPSAPAGPEFDAALRAWAKRRD